jgi:hypothetical protein
MPFYNRQVTEPLHESGGLGRRFLLLTAVGVVFSAFIYFSTQVEMLARGGWSWDAFRAYGIGDQLSNFGVVVNASSGNFSPVEPYTETGDLNDPHLYLEALGAISRFGHVAPTVVWNAGGITLQIILVSCISVSTALVTRRWWTSLLGAVPFLIGTLSFPGWYTAMTSPGMSHGVLWGAFGVMFPLNEGSASLAIGGTAFVLLLSVLSRTDRRRKVIVASLVAGAVVGLLANIDTYSFFVATFFAVYGIAVYAMTVRGRLFPWVITLLLVILIFLVGPSLVSSLGRLNAFSIGLVPAIPGVILAIGRWRAAVITPLLALAAAASPQLVSTSIAIAHGEAFLKFREASSTEGGIFWKDGLLSAMPLAIPLLIILIAGIHRARPLWVTYSLGTSIPWLILAKNEAWGTYQEPYQLWIDSFALIAFTIVPIGAQVAMTYLPLRSARQEQIAGSWRVAVASLCGIAIAVCAVSSIDWYQFYRSQEGQTISFIAPVDHSMRSVAAHITDKKLVIVDSCLGVDIFKGVTGARVAAYNPGLAWPARHLQISAAWVGIANEHLTAAELDDADIGWMVTERGCSDHWDTEFASLFRATSSSSYPGGNLTVWRIRDGNLR